MLQVTLLDNGMTVEFEVANLFPTPVAGVTLDYDFNKLKEFKKFSLHSANNKVANQIQEVFNPAEPDFYILDKVPEIKKYLTNVVRDLLNTQYGYQDTFVINTSWLTKMVPSAQGQKHDHIGQTFSAVLYFDEYKILSSNLTLFSPLNKINRWGLKNHPENPATWKDYIVTPKKNLLIVFPSYLDHQIGWNESQDTRYSLAFNILPLNTYNGHDSQVNMKKLIEENAC